MPYLPIGPGQDDADAVLERALRMEIGDHPRSTGLTASLVLHAAFVLVLSVAVLPEEEPVAPPAHRPVVTQIFIPPPPVPAPPPDGSPKAMTGTRDAVPVETPAAAVANVAVELSAIQISFPADVRNQLPAVVAAQGGVLALLDKENPAIARYIFRPPDWRAEETITDVTGKVRLLMDPPQKWPVFRNIARSNGLDLGGFLACAIFDISYRHCLQTAIRSRIPAASSGRVTAARLAFNADRPCGLEVLDVSVAAAK